MPNKIFLLIQLLCALKQSFYYHTDCFFYFLAKNKIEKSQFYSHGKIALLHSRESILLIFTIKLLLIFSTKQVIQTSPAEIRQKNVNVCLESNSTQQ
jgi:hypothetical protein